MIVAVDATPALRRELSGTEVYARSLIEALVADRSARHLRLYANASTAPDWLRGQVEWRPIPFPRLWTHWRFARALMRERSDVVFVPSHVLPLTLAAPGVVTIHDVGHRHERRSYRPADWLYLELTTRWMARHATRLVAVSQSTADDLRRFYGIGADRVTVVHSGVDPSMHEPAPDELRRVRDLYRLPSRYFLYVGRPHPRKNLPFLGHAFAQARRDGVDAALVLVGPGHAPSQVEGVHVLPYVPSGDLSALYGGALALVLPSRFEGFGFPALEAMRCGTPVVASTAGALPEVVGQAGILLDPGDGPAWIEAMQRLAGDDAARQDLIQRGRVWSALFTWPRSARGVWRILDEVAGQPAAAR